MIAVHGADPEPPRSAERELRLLLERVVPRPAAPAERMRRVRRRVALRRRRVAVLTASASAAAAVVLAVSLRPVVTGGVPDERVAPAASPSAGSGEAALRLSGTFELRLRLPGGWHVRTVPGTRTALGFAADRPLDGGGPCPAARTYALDCAPVPALAPDGALIAFQQMTAPPGGRDMEPKGAFTTGDPRPPEKDCRALGGDRELTGWAEVLTGTDDPALFQARVCLDGTSGRALAEVRKILATATFHSAPVPAPTEAEDD
ncbi:hypothetical protein V1L54_01870 [Streptomyces sp. TRM 70361]|uniref:hypothetical protein n=1 Tax=Streptomyces sp. TRM 70361 TaxID=3116553 RepID=UPI002E7B0838|nr:hypothetical protein [Streptomyces sp. TRM 70361]MEE1938175.1 hypothetical protein [Streptomyces sp. TRM 70361]